MSKNDTSVSAAGIDGLTTNYAFDAIRIPWRIALDYQWNQTPQAKSYLESLNFLSSEYESKSLLHAGYTHHGQPILQTENPATYATSLGYFATIKPDQAAQLYQDKILRLYSNDTNSFRDDLPYYDENWLWFGAALYSKFLIPFE